MEALLKILRTPRTVTLILIIFYAVGIAGMVWELTRPYFIHLTPFALLLSAFFLIINHQGKFKWSDGLVFALIYLAGFLLEMVGVNTGLIFGEYTYGEGLGLKIAATPLMIGLNWLMLIYISAAVFQSLRFSPVWVIVAGSTMLLIYDLVLEQVAPVIDLWSWVGDVIPFRNYVSWWIVAALMHIGVVAGRVRIVNPVAISVYSVQLLFFVLILILM